MWTMTESLKSLSKMRIERTKTTLEEVRASVEASWKIMKETRFTNATTLIEEMIEQILPDHT